MSYFGDCKNNMTYDLMRGAAIMGFKLNVSGPLGIEYDIEKEVWEEVNELCKFYGSPTVTYHTDPKEAVKDCDVVYTDSWKSYGIPITQKKRKRKKFFLPYQVNNELMKLAKEDAIFMNCLPAERGAEQTSEIIDGKQSVVFDQAENRLHMQNSIVIHLLN